MAIAQKQAIPLGPPELYLKVRGNKQGWFPGTSKSRPDEIDAEGWNWTLAIPQSSGQISGKRQYSPIRVKIAIDKTSPLFIQACSTHELLPEVLISCYRSMGTASQKWYGLKLGNATISRYQEVVVTPSNPPGAGVQMVNEIDFSFTSIQVEYGGPGGNTMVSDNVGGSAPGSGGSAPSSGGSSGVPGSASMP